jgi:cyclic dehypoxanthinyl futalosine synthase
LRRVRDLQDETGVFTSFIPWTFQPEHTELGVQLPDKTTPAEYLRMLASARIFLHNFVNIQSSWVTQGIKVCQTGLAFGGNDVGSAMLEENVVSAAGCSNMTSVAEIERHIRDAGFEPARRNMLFERLSPPAAVEPLAVGGRR